MVDYLGREVSVDDFLVYTTVRSGSRAALTLARVTRIERDRLSVVRYQVDGHRINEERPYGYFEFKDRHIGLKSARYAVVVPQPEWASLYESKHGIPG